MLTFTNAATNIVFDGDSIFANPAPTNADRIGEKMMALAPINGGMTYKNIALGGATFKSMAGNGSSGIAEVHAAYESGKENILYLSPVRNTVDMKRADGSPYTVDDVIADAKAYTAAVLAVHPWRIFIAVALPFQNNASDDPTKNAVIDAFNDYLRSNYAALGAEGFVETRPPGGPFAYSPPYNYSESTFTKSGLYQDATHPTSAGNTVLAPYFANHVATIPGVAPGAAASTASSGGNILFGWL